MMRDRRGRARFPLAATVSLVMVTPCAAMIHLVGEITGAGMAAAVLAVSSAAVYGMSTLLGWAGDRVTGLAFNVLTADAQVTRRQGRSTENATI